MSCLQKTLRIKVNTYYWWVAGDLSGGGAREVAAIKSWQLGEGRS